MFVNTRYYHPMTVILSRVDNRCLTYISADDNCVENFENSPDNNRKLMKQQECPCDKEHMFSCPSDTSISTKSGPSLDSVIEQLGNMVRQLKTLTLHTERVVASNSCQMSILICTHLKDVFFFFNKISSIGK